MTLELPPGNSFDNQMRRETYSRSQVEGIVAQRDAEIVRLRALAGVAYAGLVGECDLPEAWADAFLAASEGKEFTTEGLIPLVR